MRPYAERVLDGVLDRLLPELPAIALEGPKAVGKTRTAKRRARTTYELDDPAQRQVAKAAPSRLAEGEPPILIDEWQRVPESWDVVRRAVDDDYAPGRFLLTGSATPTEPPTHSGAGRIVTVRMRPMTLSERGLGAPTVSMGELIEGGRPEVTGQTDVAIEDYTEAIIASGLPGIQHLKGRARREALNGYLRRIVETDFEQQGHPVRKPSALRRWMTAFAAATATTASYETIRDAATGGHGEKPARSTTQPYRDTLTDLWIVDQIPAWQPSRNYLSQLGKSPKHHLADPALAARLLGVGAGALLRGEGSGPPIPRDGTLLGHLFESLATLCVRVYARAVEASVGHLRTHGGRHEVDLIVHRDDGRFVAIEIKLGREVEVGDAEHLLWLREEAGEDCVDAMVVTTGPHAFRHPDGFAVVPLALLGP